MLVLLSPIIAGAQETEREFYQLKIYHFENTSQLEVTENYLRNAFLPAMKKMNQGKVGVFKPKADSLQQLYILLPIASLQELSILNNELLQDVDYRKQGKEYLEAPAENPPYGRIEVIVMQAFEDMPFMRASQLEGPRKERVYELRSYQSPTEAYLKNKIEMFNEGGEIALFEELGFNAVFYGEVLAGSHTPNLMYLTTFSNQASRDKHWDSFGNSPKWKAMAAIPKYEGNVSHIDIHYLYPTEYSDY